MFTGITTDMGEVLSVEARAEGLQRLKIACRYPRSSIELGASIACSGICLTVVGTGEEGGRTWFEVDTAAETLKVTTAGQWKRGTRLNLERSLKIGDELGGHLVAGHVDGVAQVTLNEALTGMARMTLRASRPLMRFIAPKGAIVLDGVSLTVNEITHDTFTVLIIPHTMEVTTFGAIKAGDGMNIEVDMMARYVARLIETR
jgi:riboflavin synthase